MNNQGKVEVSLGDRSYSIYIGNNIVKNSNTQLKALFYKSKDTGRWWFSSSMDFDNEANYKEKIIACSYEDYLQTLAGDIPKRIYRILKAIT